MNNNYYVIQVAVLSLQSFTFAVGMATFILLSQSKDDVTSIYDVGRGNGSRHSNQLGSYDPPLIGEQIWIPFLVGYSS